MELVTKEIATAINSLAIPQNSFRLFSDEEAKPLFVDLINKFVEGGERRWWWEAFSAEDYSIEFDDSKAFKRIIDIAPNPLD